MHIEYEGVITSEYGMHVVQLPAEVDESSAVDVIVRYHTLNSDRALVAYEATCPVKGERLILTHDPVGNRWERQHCADLMNPWHAPERSRIPNIEWLPA